MSEPFLSARGAACPESGAPAPPRRERRGRGCSVDTAAGGGRGDSYLPIRRFASSTWLFATVSVTPFIPTAAAYASLAFAFCFASS